MGASHAAVVLAAGGSTRLGQPKQLLTRDGEPLVHRAVRLAAATAPRALLVVVGANADLISAALADLPHTVIPNRDWSSGLGGSLRQAGRQVSNDVACVLVLACDQPALEAHHLQALVEGAGSASSGCAATLHGDALGVPAVVPRAWFDEADAMEGDAGFGHRLRRLPAGAVFALRAPELSLDIDTPGDLEQARASGRVDPAPG